MGLSFPVIWARKNIKTKWCSTCTTPISAMWRMSLPTWKNTAVTVVGATLTKWDIGIGTKGVAPMLPSTNLQGDSTKCLCPFSIVWKSLTSWFPRKIVSTPGLSFMILKRSSLPSQKSNLPLVWNGCGNTSPSRSVWHPMSPDSKKPSVSWTRIPKNWSRAWWHTWVPSRTRLVTVQNRNGHLK